MNNKRKGKLIVIEGASDGIGKTTQFELLKARLENEGLEVFYHHFPSYQTYHGAPVEKYLAGEFGTPDELSPYFINSLYAVDRVIAWNTILKKEYEKGKIILLDRYTTSSLIYQASVIPSIDERKKFIDYVIDFEYSKLGIKEPDNVIFLTAPFDVIANMRNKRVSNDGVLNDIHERNLEYLKKVYENSMFVADYLSWDKIDCSENGKMRPIEDIQQEVYNIAKR